MACLKGLGAYRGYKNCCKNATQTLRKRFQLAMHQGFGKNATLLAVVAFLQRDCSLGTEISFKGVKKT